MTTIQIISDRFVAGITIESGIVKDAAPIVKYMKGWTLEKALEYCKQKGWAIQYASNMLIDQKKGIT